MEHLLLIIIGILLLSNRLRTDYRYSASRAVHPAAQSGLRTAFPLANLLHGHAGCLPLGGVSALPPEEYPLR